MKMTERGQITIPKAIRDKYGFTPQVEIDVKVENGVVIIQPRRDMSSFDAAAQRWLGSGKERIRKMGFRSSEDFFRALRGR